MRLALLAACGAGLLVLAACERNATESEPARVENTAGPAVTSPDAADVGGSGESPRASADEDRSERTDPRDGPQPEHDSGAPVWAANSDRSGAENAERQFERNGDTFGADTVEEYVDRAHAFISNPPAGAERATRASNGDRLIYDPKTNTFAVATREGAPRTMFKPDDGAEYWARQKQQASRSRRGGDDRG